MTYRKYSDEDEETGLVASQKQQQNDPKVQQQLSNIQQSFTQLETALKQLEQQVTLIKKQTDQQEVLKHKKQAEQLLESIKSKNLMQIQGQV